MTTVIYILTIIFGIVCFGIVKTKRYKVMPLICTIMFIFFNRVLKLSLSYLSVYHMVKFWFIRWERLY